MKGRSAEQVAAYEANLDDLVAILDNTPMTVREIQDVFAVEVARDVWHLPAAATVYARIAALIKRGHDVKRQKRRSKISGKSGQRERVFSVIR